MSEKIFTITQLTDSYSEAFVTSTTNKLLVIDKLLECTKNYAPCKIYVTDLHIDQPSVDFREWLETVKESNDEQ